MGAMTLSAACKSLLLDNFVGSDPACRLEGICDKLHCDCAVCVPGGLRRARLCGRQQVWHVALRPRHFPDLRGRQHSAAAAGLPHAKPLRLLNPAPADPGSGICGAMNEVVRLPEAVLRLV